ncbi:hypothetical protein AB205_0160950, partial [Aquarana catesbeiana]
MFVATAVWILSDWRFGSAHWPLISVISQSTPFITKAIIKGRSLKGTDEVGNVDCVKFLIEMGANLEARDCDFGTPLHVACGRQRLECVRVLLLA